MPSLAEEPWSSDHGPGVSWWIPRQC